MSQAQEALKKVIRPSIVPASQTNFPISKAIKMNESGALNYRMDIIVGKVVVAAAISAKLQDSSGFNIWNDLNSVSITASTTKTIVSADSSTSEFEVTAHGYVLGQPVIFNQVGQLPTGVLPHVVYYALPVDANHFQVAAEPGSNNFVKLSDNGSGSNEVTAARLFTIKVSSVDAGSAALIPMRSALRAVLTTGAGDSCQVAECLSIQ